MRTVKEISKITNISVRTLHYYDEIGLLKPTDKSNAGYRLYDDQALETLQQILFFREFDIPLKEIKTIMEHPDLDQNKILRIQRKMLVEKKERMERLITNIDDILKGENKMDFQVFNKSELEELCQTTLNHMPDFLKESIVQEFGGIDQWREHYLERCSKEDMQKGYQKIVEWYGGKEAALKAMNHPPTKEIGTAFAKRIEAIEKKLSEKRGNSINSFEVKQLVGEYGFVMKQFMQVKQEAGLMMSVASNYRDDWSKQKIDQKYGEGMAEFFAQAIENFYQKEINE